MAKQYSQFHSIGTGEANLAALEKRISELRLSQSSAKDKREWHRIAFELDDLTIERRLVIRRLAQLQVKEHHKKKQAKVDGIREMGEDY